MNMLISHSLVYRDSLHDGLHYLKMKKQQRVLHTGISPITYVTLQHLTMNQMVHGGCSNGMQKCPEKL